MIGRMLAAEESRAWHSATGNMHTGFATWRLLRHLPTKNLWGDAAINTPAELIATNTASECFQRSLIPYWYNLGVTEIITLSALGCDSALARLILGEPKADIHNRALDAGKLPTMFFSHRC